jgi:hypothetical protein
VHGVEQDGQSIPPDLPTLAEDLRGRGYRTYGVYSGPYLDPRFGFARGFERYEAGYGPELANAVDEVAVAEKLVKSLDVAKDPERMRVAVQRRGDAERELELASHRDVSSQRVTDLVVDELERAKEDERPFFVFAHFFDPHYDYNPPPPYVDAFDPEYSGTLGPRDYFTNEAIAAFDPASPSGRRRTVDERGLEHLKALYAGEIAWTDSKIGTLLDALAQRRLAENTLVIVVGDHGDEFFEHGSIGHRRTLDAEVVRVPWIMRLPGELATGERRKNWMALSGVRDEILGLVEPNTLRWRFASGIPLGRLVHMDMVRRTWPPQVLDGPFQKETEEGILLSVIETFRYESIEVSRRRFFAHGLGSESSRMLDYYYDDLLADDEHLRWIDLDAHPDEPDDAWSTNFDDPRANAALSAFRRANDLLLKERRAPPLVPESADMLAALRGLGYAGQEARIGTIASDELVLPPPGESLLGESVGR